MNRQVIFTRERESATYRVEVFDANGSAVVRKDGRSYEFCLLAEHIERLAGNAIDWNHRGVEPELSEAALRGCVTYTGARA
jgi:Fic family protein